MRRALEHEQGLSAPGARRAGIGPGLLHEHGIKVQHEPPGVGENLQDPLQASAVCGVQEAPRIQAPYLSTPEDRQVAADSLRPTRRIAAMPALPNYRPREMKPGVLRHSDGASVMPTITCGNTNSPTLMIAERAAARTRQDTSS